MHFPEGSELSRLFNKKSVKLSYSCMPSMKSLISGHNKKLLRRLEDNGKIERGVIAEVGFRCVLWLWVPDLVFGL